MEARAATPAQGKPGLTGTEGLRQQPGIDKTGQEGARRSDQPPGLPLNPDQGDLRVGQEASSGRPGTEGTRLPKGTGQIKEGEEGSQGQKGTGEKSIASSLRNLERRLQDTGPPGSPTGTGQQMGPLFFDPEGADFTAWLNHFKNEVYRNWIVPQPALLGFRGHVDIEFTVERDGRISDLKVLKSTGTPALDRAAQNALLGSRFLPLPAEFGPARVTMQGSFYYNEGPQGS
jgi:TonB family protein